MTIDDGRARKGKRRWLGMAAALILIALLGWGYSWASYARPPLEEALAALESDDQVQVEQQPWLIFKPQGTSPKTGLIFYPGGRIDPRGYAPLLREIAARGYLVVVPSMPLNMAAFDINAADEIISAYPQISRWAIGGHSVGGTMAAQYTSRHLDLISGLVIWASFPADSADLSGADLPVSTIYGTLDPRADPANVLERAQLLPPGTVYIAIEGGDHHQFGSYLIDPREDLAVISRADQQGQIIQATLNLLDMVDQSAP
jgi:pimeloyl-ACP methyl ester carboxylesterase